MGILGGEVTWRLRYQYVDMDQPLTEVPSVESMVVEFLGFLVVFEIMFYHSHRLLHTAKLYKYHKVILAKLFQLFENPPFLLFL